MAEEEEVNPKAYPLAKENLTVTILDLVQQAAKILVRTEKEFHLKIGFFPDTQEHMFNNSVLCRYTCKLFTQTYMTLNYISCQELQTN